MVEDEDEASIQDASEGILGEHALPPEMAAVLNHLVSQVGDRVSRSLHYDAPSPSPRSSPAVGRLLPARMLTVF